jgi:hypothetical protein
MPIKRESGETKEEFVSRCIKVEMDNGKPQDQALAICLTYADEYFTSNFADSYTDYPKAATENAKTALRWAEENGWGDCGTPVGKARANQLANGEPISRETISRMAAFERHRQNSQRDLGDGCGRLMWLAWGGDEGIEWAQRKLEQIDKLSATSSVSDATWSTEAPISTNLRRAKVIFEEDFDIEEAKKMKDLGFKVYVRSSRKIQRKDRKIWNKLKQANLTEDNLVFGSIEQLDKKHQFDLFLTGEDPLLEAFSARGEIINPKRVIKTIPIESIEDAEIKQEEFLNSKEMKFLDIKFFYKYEEIPGIPPAQNGSRPFCKRMLSTNKSYTLDEIKQLSNTHLVKMFKNYAGLEPDVFLYRGGFYRLPGTLNTTPWCRHQWTLQIVR